ncbi:hypothetical protein D3C87_1071640 [compost metagenome]
MGLTREDYAELGRKDAQTASGGKAPAHMPQGSKASWQTKAYDEAFAAEMARLEDSLANLQVQGGQTIKTFDMTAASATSIAWPHGAREHVLRLTFEMIKEGNPPRRERLYGAIVRMQQRHNKPRTQA